MEIHGTIRKKLQDSRRILIVSHVRPDGDAVGSMIGLGLALIAAGKDVRMVLADGVPHNFRHLKGSEQVHRSVPKDQLSQYDLTVVVDCSDLQRTGGVLGERKPDVNIDHHVTNLGFAETNLVLPEEVATSSIITEYLQQWGLGYNKDIASALLTGIVTDTIGYRTSNMNPDALRQSAMLMEMGADLPDLYVRALVSKSYEAARYWGFGLSKLQKEDHFIWTSLTLEDRRAAGYGGNDDADLVNILSTVESDVAVIFVEQKDGHVKISWRARPGFDVSQIALQFGGGGHPAAAGADIRGSMKSVMEQVLDATREMLSRVYSSGDGQKPAQP